MGARVASRGFGALELPAGAWGRIARLLLAVAAGAIAVVLAVEWIVVLSHPEALTREIGGDFRLYTDAARRWLDGSTFYQPWQLNGPYVPGIGVILYPPPMLLLLAPFTVLPGLLWWALPAVVVGGAVRYHRPRLWAWPLMLAGLAVPHTGVAIVNGTPTIWIVALVALATVWSVGPLILLKPSLAPFALIGIGRKEWWWTAAVSGLVSAGFLPLWLQYARVITDGGISLAYSLPDVPFLLVPVFAWLGSRRRSP